MIAEITSQKGRSAASILDDIENRASKVKSAPRPWLIPDPSTPVSVYEQAAFHDLAENLRNRRASDGDAATLEMIRSWEAAKVPAFRRVI